MAGWRITGAAAAARRRSMLALVLPAVLVVPLAAATVAAVAPGVAAASGSAWAVQTTATPPPQPQEAACPTAQQCVAVGGSTGVVTTDGGSTWQDATLPAGTSGLSSVACPSTTTCVAVASVASLSGGLPSTGAVLVSHDGGLTWSTTPVPAGTPGLTSVSCGSPTDCVAVGPDLNAVAGLDRSAAGGGPGAGPVSGARLPSAAERSVALLARRLPAGAIRDELLARLVGAAPPAAARARAAASGQVPSVLVSTDGGSTWTAASGPASVLGTAGTVSCATATACTLVAATASAVSTDGGATWSAAGAIPGPAGITSIGSVSCPSATGCVAVGDAVQVGFGTGGTGGTGGTVGAGAGTAAGGLGSVLIINSVVVLPVVDTSSDGGRTWVQATVPSPPSGVEEALGAVGCSSARACVAVGSALPESALTGAGTGLASSVAPLAEYSTDGGSTWALSAALPRGVSTLSGVACVPASSGSVPAPAGSSGSGGSIGTCLAVGSASALASLVTPGIAGGDALATADTGVTWGAVQDLPPGVDAYQSVSCASPTSCVAVGDGSSDSGAATGTADGGASWSSGSVPAAAGMLLGVSCPPAGHCVAVGGQGLAGPGTVATSADGGGTWTVGALPAGTGALSAVSCATATACVAVGTARPGDPEAVVSSDGGASWTAGVLPGGITNLVGVDCPTAQRCLAVGTSAGASTILPVLFSQRRQPAPFTAGGVILASNDGGLRWAPTPVPVDAEQVQAVSCPTVTDCVAVGVTSNDGGGELAGANGFVLTSADGGVSWQPRALPVGTTALDDVSCASAADCVAVGSAEGASLGVALAGQAAVLVSGDGGATWSAAPVPAQAAGLAAVSCPTATMCEASGTDTQGGGMVMGTGAAEPPPASPPALAMPLQAADPASYWMVGADGGVFAFGQASYEGSMGGRALVAPVVGMAVDSASGGYWEAARDGGIFAFGGAPFLGSMGGTPLASPVTAIAADPAGVGYWEVAADGGVFAYGTAGYHGSVPALPPAQRPASPVIDLVPTPDGGGYWEVDWAGDVFAFGDAGFFGSMGGQRLSAAIVGMATTPDGLGYWLVGADGGVFAFGDAPYLGSTGALHLAQPIVAVDGTADGDGYWMVARDGGVFAFGDAGFAGSLGGRPLTAPVVAMASL